MLTTATRCPYCHDDCPPRQPSVVCGDCRAPHHPDCWALIERCACCEGERCLREDNREDGIRLIAGLGAIPMAALALACLAIAISFASNSFKLEDANWILGYLGAPAFIFGALTAILARLAFSGIDAAKRMARGDFGRSALAVLGFASTAGFLVSLQLKAGEGLVWPIVGLFALVPALALRRHRRSQRSPRPREEAAVELEAALAKGKASKIRGRVR